ncbi:MAG: hypothetical protein GY696_07890, partial [Gammaproteobacteria bacterium]|nr:hypothetical protein [Gammaproteobacteria bacterium]
MNILQYNINGISGKLDELLHYMNKNDIMIAALQETKLTSKSNTKKTPGYTMLRKDRGSDKGGGLAFLIHESINFQTVPNPPRLNNDPHIETDTINIPGKGNSLTIRNVYIPPQSSCVGQYTPAIEDLLDDLPETSLIIGDLNAHHTSWYTEGNEDSRGRHIINIIEGKNIGVLNEDTPTRTANNSATAPDVSLATSDILPTTTWKTENILSSDHLPIIITIDGDFKRSKSKNRTFLNFAKTDSTRYKEYIEDKFSTAPTVKNVHKSKKFFPTIVSKAAKQFIPAGRILKPISNVPTVAAEMMTERDEIREANPSDPRL